MTDSSRILLPPLGCPGLAPKAAGGCPRYEITATPGVAVRLAMRITQCRTAHRCALPSPDGGRRDEGGGIVMPRRSTQTGRPGLSARRTIL